MPMYQPDQTVTFPLASDKERQNRMILQEVYSALLEKGYNPINQIVGYLLSEDPTYIPDYKGARGMIRHLSRDELLGLFIEYYFENHAK